MVGKVRSFSRALNGSTDSGVLKLRAGARATAVFLDARMMMGRGRGRAGAPLTSRGRAAGVGGPGNPGCLRLAASQCRAAWGSLSGRKMFSSMQASLLLLSRSRAPGPRRLALLAGTGAVAAAAREAAGGREGARVPGAASLLLDGPPSLLGVL